MEDRLIVLVAALVVATVVGLLARDREARAQRRGFVPAAGPSAPVVDVAVGGLGAVVVVGTRACATCARTHALLAREAAATDGAVVASHVLVEDRPDLAAALDIRTAPTVLLTDARGAVVGRHEGGLDATGARAAVASLAGERAR